MPSIKGDNPFHDSWVTWGTTVANEVAQKTSRVLGKAVFGLWKFALQ